MLAAADTRQRLLDEAEDLIRRVGVNGMSYQDLSDRVGIRKASIHHHFPAKEDLVAELLARYCSHYIERFRTVADGAGTGRRKLEKIAALFADCLDDGKVCLIGMMGADLLTLPDPLRHSVRGFIRESEAAIASIVDQGRRDGSLAAAPKPEVAGRFLFSFLEGAQLVCRADGGSRRFREQAAAQIALLAG